MADYFPNGYVEQPAQAFDPDLRKLITRLGDGSVRYIHRADNPSIAVESLIWDSTGKINLLLDGAANVKNYGAKGDGSTFDNVAFEKAIDASDYIVYLPPGVYRLSSLTPLNNKPRWFIGCGSATTILFDTTGEGMTFIGSLDSQWEQVRRYRVSNVRLGNVNQTPSTFISNQCINTLIDNVFVWGGLTTDKYVKVTYAIDGVKGYGLTLRDCQFIAVMGSAMVRLRQTYADDTHYNIASHIEDCDFSVGSDPVGQLQNTGVGLEVEGGGNTKIDGCVFQLLNKAIRTNTISPSRRMTGLNVSHSTFEQNITWDIECNNGTSETDRNIICVRDSIFTAPYSGKIKATRYFDGVFENIYGSLKLYGTSTSGGLAHAKVTQCPGFSKDTTYQDMILDNDGAWNEQGGASPAVTTTGTGVTLGNGSLTAEWCRMPGGLARLLISFKIGSTTTIGTGTLQFTESVFYANFPANIQTTGGTTEGGTAYFYRASTGGVVTGLVQPDYPTNTRLIVFGSGGQLGGTPPWGGSWAVGDEIRLVFTYLAPQR